MGVSGCATGTTSAVASASCWVADESPIPTIASRSSMTSGMAWARGVGIGSAVLPLSHGGDSCSPAVDFATTSGEDAAAVSFSAGDVSITTVPANGVGRSPASQISAGARRSSVNKWDQPVLLVTVARQTALPSSVGCNMPWSCSTLKTAVLFAGMPSMPCDSRWARSLSETVLLTSHSASSVSQPSEASG